MRNTWGRPPKNELWSDLQALAIWVFIIGIVGYLLFPSFFHNVYTALTDPFEDYDEIGEITLPASAFEGEPSEEPPDLDISLYSDDSEISQGFWAIFVGDNQFKQLPLTTESYAFLLKIIDGDKKAESKNTLLLAANGKIHKHEVSDEVYDILLSLSKINSRSGSI